MIRTGLLYDAHIPYHDRSAYAIALDYLQEKEIDQLIIAGDFVDFYKVSSWAQDPDRMPFKDEVKMAREELTMVRCMFSNIPIQYIEGNHENRLNFYIKKQAPAFKGLWDVPTALYLDDLEIEYVSNIERMYHNRPPLSLGKLFVLHGHEIRAGFSSVNLARLYYFKAHNSLIVGHHHTSQKYTQKKLDLTYDGCWIVGTLGQLQEPYMPVNNWVHGFAYVDHDPETGFFDVHNKIIMNGKVYHS